MTDVLRIEESRYGRLEQISWWDQARLRRAQVLVAGAGALGNELLKHLGLLGVGRIVVVDLDTIEVTNLSRAIFFRARDTGQAKAEVVARCLEELNPDVRVLPIVGDLRWDLGLGLVRRMDVVLGGLDSFGARLGLNRMCWLAGVPWIDGAVDELNGVVRMFVPPEGACFECGMTDADYRHLNARHSCQLLPREGIVEMPVPTSPTSASMVAAWQVQEAIKWLHGRPTLASQGVSCHGATYEFFKPRYARRLSCLAHEGLGEIHAVAEASHRMTVSELLALLVRRWGAGIEVEVDREIVLEMSCSHCGILHPLRKPLFRVLPREALCPRCGNPCDPVLTHRLDDRPALADAPLCELGVPPLHVLTARQQGGQAWSFELTGDAARAPLASFLRHEDDDGNS